MKAIGIVGSPRKNSNTQILVEAILKGAEEKGMETKLFRLNEMNIKPCQGCNFCQENGICKQKDDMQKLYEAISTCDTLVLGSPIYMSYVTAQTKIFLDRLYALLKIGGEPRIPPGKKCVLVFTQGGGTDGKKIMENIAQILKGAFNMEVKAIVGDNNLNTEGEVRKRKELLKEAYSIGQEL
ncbi:MAG: NADPH-dependent FMN reductase [bacterium 42_11]|nr:MAG: NADPH-dependent FMN reductase [bacterium 42_11]